MNNLQRPTQAWLVLALAIVCTAFGCRRPGRPDAGVTSAGVTTAGESVAVIEVDTGTTGPTTPAVAAGVGDIVEIPIYLPAPAFRGTPKVTDEKNVAPPGKSRGPFLAPKGTVNLALGKPVSTSDPVPSSGEVDFVTDGDKEATDFGYLELRPGTEWVQIDLGTPATIYGVLIGHNHAEERVFRDVVVQLSNDPDFLNAKTVFNNDYDNSSGLGVGPDMGYAEVCEGKLIDCRGAVARYVRCYSKGNHRDNKNHYTEVEVYGRPGT